MNVRTFSLVLCIGALCGCTREYDCLCGQSDSEPYVYTVSAQNLDDAIVECVAPGSEFSKIYFPGLSRSKRIGNKHILISPTAEGE